MMKAMLRIIPNPQHSLHATHDLIVDGQPFVVEELPQRAEILLQAVTAAGLGPVTAPIDYGLEPIRAVHAPDYLDYLQTIYAECAAYYHAERPVLPETFATRHPRHRSRHSIGRKGYYCFGTGSPILAGTWTAAYWSAQAALTAAQALRDGEQAAYALCRPPGHHAAADLYGGFCYLNNAAIAARALEERVAILDIDYHHGNGTQEIFYRDPGVLFCSLHAHPDDEYPFYWGTAEECGEDEGLGYNSNWPLPLHTPDGPYLQALDQALERIASFAPRYLVVSAGFDLAAGDPVGAFEISLDGLHTIGRRIAGLGLPILIVQEGGYNLDRLGECAVAFLTAFS